MTAERTGMGPRYLAVAMTELPTHDDWLTESESTRLQAFAYTKRREEARLGRWTAKRALAGVLGLVDDDRTLRGLVIRNAADGAPEVFVDERPAPVQISMTDRADWAVCTVVAGGTAIGCDLEVVEPRSRTFVRDYLTEAEQAYVLGGSVDTDLAANLVWSAKESALKVLRTGLRRDTRSVEVAPEREVVGGWAGLRVVTAEGDRFPGWWRRFGDFVLTFASAESWEPPESLLEPSPLHRAVPAHSWMDQPRRGAAT